MKTTFTLLVLALFTATSASAYQLNKQNTSSRQPTKKAAEIAVPSKSSAGSKKAEDSSAASKASDANISQASASMAATLDSLKNTGAKSAGDGSTSMGGISLVNTTSARDGLSPSEKAKSGADKAASEAKNQKNQNDQKKDRNRGRDQDKYRGK